MDRPPPPRKRLVLLSEGIKSPPFSPQARLEAGRLLRRLQEGDAIEMPHSRPMPSIGPKCHELRVRDETKSWRIVYRIDHDAILIAAVFAKTTRTTPKHEIDVCQARLRAYDQEARKHAKGDGR